MPISNSDADFNPFNNNTNMHNQTPSSPAPWIVSDSLKFKLKMLFALLFSILIGSGIFYAHATTDERQLANAINEHSEYSEMYDMYADEYNTTIDQTNQAMANLVRSRMLLDSAQQKVKVLGGAIEAHPSAELNQLCDHSDYECLGLSQFIENIDQIQDATELGLQ